MWQWQPALRYHLIDEGAFSAGDLAVRDGLPALLFRLENSSDPGELVALGDAVLAGFAGHRGFAAALTVLVALLGAAMAPLGAGVRVPQELLEVRNMLATRAEEWQQQWLHEGRQEGLREGKQEGRLEGEVALLLRLLERRFGVLPAWARERVLAADTVVIEEWGLRVLDAVSLEEVFA
jgi:hypothetical protein